MVSGRTVPIEIFDTCPPPGLSRLRVVHLASGVWGSAGGAGRQGGEGGANRGVGEHRGEDDVPRRQQLACAAARQPAVGAAQQSIGSTVEPNVAPYSAPQQQTGHETQPQRDAVTMAVDGACGKC